MIYPPHWFTAPRVRRVQRMIQLLPSASPGVGRHTLLLDLRGKLDGPREDHPDILALLKELGFIHEQSNRIWLNRKGKRAQSLSPTNARRELSEALLGSGYLFSQVRRVIEESSLDDDGNAHVRVATLRRSAPQVLGLLRAWPNVVGPSQIIIPSSLYASLDTPWSLIPLPRPDDGTKKAIGSRGEAYSYHLLRRAAKPANTITWVALDDDSLGYDIEDWTSGLTRIEVKSSQKGDVRFFLTENEHRVAHSNPDTYVLHFWGNINLRRDPDHEFLALRSLGFPLIYHNLAKHLADGRLQAVATKYRVTAPLKQNQPAC